MSTGPLLLDGSAEGGVPADGGESGGAPAPPTLARVLETSHAQTAIAKAGSKAAKRDKIRVAGRFGHAVGEGTSRWRRARRECVWFCCRGCRVWRLCREYLVVGDCTVGGLFVFPRFDRRCCNPHGAVRAHTHAMAGWWTVLWRGGGGRGGTRSIACSKDRPRKRNASRVGVFVGV